MNKLLYCGSYGTVGTRGIRLLHLDTESGKISEVGGCACLERPSYVALSKDHKYLYAVSETAEGGAIYAFSVGEAGELTVLNQLPTSGGAACHVAVDPEGNYALATNYRSGILDVFRLDPNGSVAAHTCAVQMIGSGPNQVRQEKSHAHFAAFFPEDNSKVAAVDLGSDSVWLYRLDQETGKLQEYGRIALPAGSGPRHLVFSSLVKNIMYVICELDCTVSVIRLTASGGELLQTVSGVPEEYQLQLAGAAALKESADGRFLYASTRVYEAQRGEDCVACYQVDAETGLLLKPQFISVGKEPRDICVEGDFLLTACQTGSMVQVFAMEKGVPVQKVCELDSPVASCLVVLPV